MSISESYRDGLYKPNIGLFAKNNSKRSKEVSEIKEMSEIREKSGIPGHFISGKSFSLPYRFKVIIDIFAFLPKLTLKALKRPRKSKRPGKIREIAGNPGHFIKTKSFIYCEGQKVLPFLPIVILKGRL